MWVKRIGHDQMQAVGCEMLLFSPWETGLHERISVFYVIGYSEREAQC
jgi:hypothetical protein